MTASNAYADGLHKFSTSQYFLTQLLYNVKAILFEVVAYVFDNLTED